MFFLRWIIHYLLLHEYQDAQESLEGLKHHHFLVSQENLVALEGQVDLVDPVVQRKKHQETGSGHSVVAFHSEV